MGVQVDAGILVQQARRRGQLLGRGGRREARGDRVLQAPVAVPALDQRAALGVATGRGIAQRRRRVAVHQHLAGDHPQAALLRGLEECLGGYRMDRAEHQRGSGAVAQQFVEEQLGLGGGVAGIGKALLGGKGVGFQPVQQLGAVGGDHSELRVMHMAVDEAGQQQALRMLLQRQVGGQLRQQVGCVIERAHVAVFDPQQAVLEILPGLVAEFRRVAEEMQDPPAMGRTAHRAPAVVGVQDKWGTKLPAGTASFISSAAGMALSPL